MAGSNTKIVFDVQANINQIKNSASEIEKTFSKLNLSQSIQKSFSGTFSNLTKEIRDFEVMASKGFNNLSSANQAEKKIDKIVTLFENLKVQAKEINGLKTEKLIPEDTLNKLKSYKNLLGEVEKLQKRDNSAAIRKTSEELEKVEKKYQGLKDKVEGFKQAKEDAEKTKGSQVKEYEDLTQKIKTARLEQEKLIEKGKNKGETEKVVQNSVAYKALTDDISRYTKEQTRANAAIKNSDTAIASNEQQIAKLTPALETAEQKYNGLVTSLEKIKNQSAVSETELNKLVDTLSEISGIDTTKLPQDLQGIANKIQELVAEGADTSQTVEQIRKLGENCATGTTQANSMKQGIHGIVEEQAGIAQVNSEVEQLKSRLGYFFSIVNGVQLFKRAIRDAYESVKELDAAMTEMAVVTEYSVGDLWNQMPQYAANANKLGTTTLDVYKSMVLYTQQGLEAAKAQELSNETLKMARIAGMESADATDAMTSALRGFNMELTEASGQRVNDVYSNLAAHAAANTEEISDAMMRTASIAHGAGMEFETTAAFLTQMINFAIYARIA